MAQAHQDFTVQSRLASHLRFPGISIPCAGLTDNMPLHSTWRCCFPILFLLGCWRPSPRVLSLLGRHSARPLSCCECSAFLEIFWRWMSSTQYFNRFQIECLFLFPLSRICMSHSEEMLARCLKSSGDTTWLTCWRVWVNINLGIGKHKVESGQGSKRRRRRWGGEEVGRGREEEKKAFITGPGKEVKKWRGCLKRGRGFI